MKKRLMTWEVFEEKFRPDSVWWDEHSSGYINIEYNGMYWYIHPRKKELFGTEIEVKKIDKSWYTHKDNHWGLHELWFEEYEFLTEEEVIIK